MNSTKTEIASHHTVAGPARAFVEYFRCPSEYGAFQVSDNSSGSDGFFRFGPALCFGHLDAESAARIPQRANFDALEASDLSSEGEIRLPFDPSEVIDNLHRERYLTRGRGERSLQALYYLLRPLLLFEIRRALQRSVTRSRLAAPFPSWPVDCSVDQVCGSLMKLAVQASGRREVPFIWFWPEGKDGAVMMTHDVEEQQGAEACEMLMDLDDSFSIKAAFQLIPEGRYTGVAELVERIRSRGFETNVHDLDHDGRLYEHRELFLQRARKINEYGRKYGMDGFRAGAMHRNQSWFDLLDFQYEMSVPTVSHLEPQRGGCCTVMPYFVGRILELPLTTVQDHSLFYILGQYSLDLWKKQIETILAHHGLVSFIVHPDYIVRQKEQDTYRALLDYLARLVRDQNLWLAFPAEINRWWRDRSQMELRQDNGSWRIHGRGAASARLAYASVVDGRLNCRIER